MKKIIFSLFLLHSAVAFSQDSVLIAKDKGYNDALVEALKARRIKSTEFFEFTKRIAMPTEMSILFTDYRNILQRSLNKKNDILNANIQTPIALGGKRWYFRTKHGEWYNALHIIPQFQVRIFQNDPVFKDDSQPVRTPGYLPRITYFGSPGSWQNEKSIKTFFISAFHHSNGQDGPERFTTDSTLKYPFWKRGLVNTYNGNFGEDLVFELGLGGSKNLKLLNVENRQWNILKRQEEKLADGKGRAIFSSFDEGFFRLQHRTSFEYHPRIFTNKVFDELDIYGRNRINMNLGLAFIAFPSEFVKTRDPESLQPRYEILTKPKLKELFRFNLDGSLITDATYNYLDENAASNKSKFNRRINLKLSFYRRFKGTENSAFFMQGGYNGSDPYNIYFGQRAYFFRFGLSFLYFQYES